VNRTFCGDTVYDSSKEACDAGQGCSVGQNCNALCTCTNDPIPGVCSSVLSGILYTGSTSAISTATASRCIAGTA
jgi:hypothetical protein